LVNKFHDSWSVTKSLVRPKANNSKCVFEIFCPVRNFSLHSVQKLLGLNCTQIRVISKNERIHTFSFPLHSKLGCMLFSVSISNIATTLHGGDGGGKALFPRGDTPLYKPYRYVPPNRVGFFAPLWSENVYILCPVWSGIGYGFRGNYGVCEPIYRFKNSKCISKEIKRISIHSKYFPNSDWLKSHA